MSSAPGRACGFGTVAAVRQLLTWRFFAAIAALVALAFGVDTVLAEPDQRGEVAGVGPSNLDADGNLIARRIDLISNVERIEQSDDFEISEDGRTVELLVDHLRAGYVHELKLENFQAQDGTELLHPEAYYTLVNIPRTQTALTP